MLKPQTGRQAGISRAHEHRLYSGKTTSASALDRVLVGTRTEGGAAASRPAPERVQRALEAGSGRGPEAQLRDLRVSRWVAPERNSEGEGPARAGSTPGVRALSANEEPTRCTCALCASKRRPPPAPARVQSALIARLGSALETYELLLRSRSRSSSRTMRCTRARRARRARHFELALRWSDAAPKMGGPVRAERAQNSTLRVAHRMKDKEVRRVLSKTNASMRLSSSRGNGALDSN